ncbi:MAG TPA: hypothetical protein VGK73_20985 [Polyangiaceae bacterium]
MTLRPDEMLQSAGLPRHDCGPAVAERIRGVALAAYRADPRARADRAPAQGTAGLWTRFLEPALVVASVVAYLTWTASTLSALHGVAAAGERDARGESGKR